ncbi:hypothetical protein PR202_ga00295 [Eleusine coracana subsp. coracana]|uniref:Uncharacterized protein n=1 Tax=Eleusine coracana subsp. coracana TaxID=191504 RepID=A0AAV5BG48_ELECO|nr:hypothetical protein PR202_ga00295 [Eleusine coracana subsp. coracana]
MALLSARCVPRLPPGVRRSPWRRSAIGRWPLPSPDAGREPRLPPIAPLASPTAGCRARARSSHALRTEVEGLGGQGLRADARSPRTRLRAAQRAGRRTRQREVWMEAATAGGTVHAQAE